MIIDDIKTHLTRWFVRTLEIGRLRSLDDRLLGDMGIDRKDIARRVRRG